MSENWSHENTPPGFLPCTREAGHDGPCALPEAVGGDREYFARILDPQAWDDTMKKSTHFVAVIQWAARKVQSLEGADRLIAAGVSPAPAPVGGDDREGNPGVLEYIDLALSANDGGTWKWRNDEVIEMLREIRVIASRSPAPQVDAADIAAGVLLDAAASIAPFGGAPLGSGASRAEISEYLRARAAALRSPVGEPTPAEPIRCEHGETKSHRFYAGLDAYHTCQFFEMGTSTPRSPVGDKP